MATASARDARDLRQQPHSGSAAARVVPHVDVLEVQPGAAAECGVGAVKDRVADGGAVAFGQQRLDPGPGPEEVLRQPLGGDFEGVGQAFVLRQAADQLDESLDVGRRRRPDLQLVSDDGATSSAWLRTAE